MTLKEDFKEIRDRLNKIGKDLDPAKTKVTRGRIERARQDLYETIIILNGMIADQKKPFWKRMFK